MNNKNIKKEKNIIMFGVAVILIVVLVAICRNSEYVAKNILSLPTNSSTTQIEDYGIFENFKGYSRLYIFPKEISEDMMPAEYIYQYKDEFLDPSAQIYLECTFNPSDYVQELERLKSISETYNGEVQSISYDTENYHYPAYVTVNGHNHCYEYALLLEENKIVYIFLQFMDREDIEIPSEYLPLNYEEKSTEGESIYVFYQKNGMGYCTY